MTSTEPAFTGGAGSPDASQARGPARRWWWVVVIAVVAVVVLLVVQPWADHETEPIVDETTSTPSPSASASSAAPTASPSPTSTPSQPPVPGADAVFDDTNVQSLFVRKPALEEAVPAAADGVRTGLAAGELPWGLPEGSTVEPPECTSARTIVVSLPPGFVARSLVNDGLDFMQELTTLPDATAAQAAFRDLVTTVDGCPEYAQVNPGIDGGSWKAEPAIEGQGVYPAIVQEIVHTAEGAVEPGYRGHVLVGNVIVTWTATALGGGDDVPAQLATLGSPESLSTMVQERAQAAVAALG
ncbi:sensor domain-containing protein [Cellulomonas gelida]|uniref:PknH-like extracellular domain-containing protein n=1 Tax=Cellulomonas gelida TaxID=1712 RepID=A0A4Y3KF40_9CELL|nr:sensor domain-containing protein [Cellulomonas gelida]GEA83051.1 hypothetical protein CGE01nite_03020 [Cellulomonas gelida]GGL30579.1 hypothetical protein GCM10009774_21160 [Cellulomonas gelida]